MSHEGFVKARKAAANSWKHSPEKLISKWNFWEITEKWNFQNMPKCIVCLFETHHYQISKYIFFYLLFHYFQCTSLIFFIQESVDMVCMCIESTQTKEKSRKCYIAPCRIKRENIEDGLAWCENFHPNSSKHQLLLWSLHTVSVR